MLLAPLCGLLLKFPYMKIKFQKLEVNFVEYVQTLLELLITISGDCVSTEFHKQTEINKKIEYEKK